MGNTQLFIILGFSLKKMSHLLMRKTIYSTHKIRKFINNSSFRTQKRSKKWVKSEIEQFYRCVNQFGTNFDLISQIFTNRSTKQLKKKFKRESLMNPSRISMCLAAKPLQMGALKKIIKKV